MTKTLTVGQVKPEDIADYVFEGHFVEDGTYYMKIEDFSHEQEIQDLYRQFDEQVDRVKNLIVDVRSNDGGSDSLYFPLIAYALDAGEVYEDKDTFGMEILYSEKNVDRRLEVFEEFLRNASISADTKTMVEKMVQELRDHRGKGFVKSGSDEDILSGIVGRDKGPEHIYVLSDVTCGSSGDNFVLMMKNTPKVTVIGRPTLGILDYSNCVMIDFDDYYFMYPTSRSLSVDAGKGMNDIGVEPDIYIPWTRDMMFRDVDLEYTLDLIKKSKS